VEPADLEDARIRRGGVEEVEEAIAVKAAETLGGADPEVTVAVLADPQDGVAGEAMVGGPGTVDVTGGETILRRKRE